VYIAARHLHVQWNSSTETLANILFPRIQFILKERRRVERKIESLQ
jgi:hypothetical protein